MTRRPVLFAFAALALATPCFSPAALAQKPLPDLVITQFGLQSWGTCKPGQTVFTFALTVRNQGSASWVGSSDVSVHDLKNTGWFTSVALLPLAPGQSRVVQLPIVYFSANPGFMASGSPHPFQARVNDTHMPLESNYANNAGPGPAVWMGKKVIMVAPPKTCGKG